MTSNIKGRGERTLGARRQPFERHRYRVLARMAGLAEDLKALNSKIDAYGRMERGS